MLRVIALMRSEQRDSRHRSMVVSRNDCWLSGHRQDISLHVLANPIMSVRMCIDANYSADIREIRCSLTGFLLGSQCIIIITFSNCPPDWTSHYFWPFPCNYCVQNNAKVRLCVVETSHAGLIAPGCICSWNHGSINCMTLFVWEVPLSEPLCCGPLWWDPHRCVCFAQVR